MKTAVAAPDDPRPLYVLLLEEVVKAAEELLPALAMFHEDIDSSELRAALDAVEGRK